MKPQKNKTAKHIGIVLTSTPESGGKFQYSLSILNAANKFDNNYYKISIFYNNDLWLKYISLGHRNIYKIKKGILGRVVRKILNFFPFCTNIWRKVNKYVHPFHRLLYKVMPDIVLYPGNDPFVYESELPGIIPIFDLMHIYESSFPEVSANAQKKRRDEHYRKVCKYAKGILVDSELGKQHVIDNYKVDRKKIFVLPYVAPPYLFQIKNEIDVIRKYNLPKRYIYYPAQFWKHKNHINLIKAIYQLKQKGVLINAIFSGSKKNCFKDLCNEIKKLEIENQINCLAYIENEEKISLYKNAIALVMPTFFGPTNIPNLEAFALGCPVAISDVYGMPEQVGDAALLFNPNDVNDIAEKIHIIWTNNNLRQKLIEKGYRKSLEWDEEKFSLELLSIIDTSLSPQK